MNRALRSLGKIYGEIDTQNARDCSLSPPLRGTVFSHFLSLCPLFVSKFVGFFFKTSRLQKIRV